MYFLVLYYTNKYELIGIYNITQIKMKKTAKYYLNVNGVYKNVESIIFKDIKNPIKIAPIPI